MNWQYKSAKIKYKIDIIFFLCEYYLALFVLYGSERVTNYIYSIVLSRHNSLL